jgi:signal transduction histidine kinase
MNILDDIFGENLSTDAQTWVGQGRPSGLLYQGEALDAAREWVRQNDVDRETWNFVEAGIISESTQGAANFLRSIAEDLVRLQTSIRGYVRLVLAEAFGPVNEEQSRFLIRIVQMAARLTWQHRDLVNYHAYILDHIPIRAAPSNIEDLLDKVFMTVRPLFPEQDMQFSIEAEPDLPEVAIDPNQLHDVLARVVMIAVQAEGAFQARLTRLAEEPFMQVELYPIMVTLLEGSIEALFSEGIHPQNLLHFNLLYLKRLVELQGGHMWISEEPDNLATIGFTLPIEPTET